MTVAEILRKYRKELLSTIDCDDVLIETLYSQDVINERQYQQIKAEKVPIQAAEKLLDFIQYAGLPAFIKFSQALDSEYAWLAEKLRLGAQEAGVDINSFANDGAPTDVGNSEEPLFNDENAIPTECQIMKISKMLVRNDWHAVMYELGLRTSDMEQSKLSNPVEKMQCKYCLTLWLRRNGTSATFKVLNKVCKDNDVDRECLTALVVVANST